jgi:hypothetical protein
MIRWDYPLSMTVWLLSLCSAPFGVFAVPLIIATTINLWHQRKTIHNAGMEFERRVHGVLNGTIQEFEKRLKAMERDVEDIKESQVKMMGAFRGRQQGI